VDQWTLALPLKVSCCNVVAVHRTVAVAFHYTAYMALYGIAVVAVHYTANVVVYVVDDVVSCAARVLGVDCGDVVATAVAGIAAAAASSLQENPLRALIEMVQISHNKYIFTLSAGGCYCASLNRVMSIFMEFFYTHHKTRCGILQYM
jgi:hypothetical protein